MSCMGDCGRYFDSHRSTVAPRGAITRSAADDSSHDVDDPRDSVEYCLPLLRN